MKRIFLLVAIMVFLSSNVCYAESNDNKVYFVDFNKVLAESKSSRKSLDALKMEMETAYKALEKKKSGIDKKRADLLQKAPLLSSSALEEKQKELQKEERDLMLEFNDKKEMYARKRNALFRSLLSKIQKVVHDLSKKNGYQLVLQKGDAFVIYANDDYDITRDVIKMFD
ncbi:MAG: OmpH family outer membrane protein [Bdellovibrionota bacterium]